MRKLLLSATVLMITAVFVGVVCGAEQQPAQTAPLPPKSSEEAKNPNARLFKAIKELDPAAVKFALEAGANPNAVSSHRSAIEYTLLYAASEKKPENDCMKVLECLFRDGAKVRPHDESLFWAIAGDFPLATRLLIAKGASPTALVDGAPPIEWAYAFDRPKVVDVLIKNGASPLPEKRVAELQLIALAKSLGANFLLKMDECLAKKADVNALNSKKERAIVNAVALPFGWFFPSESRNRFALINFLIKNGADVNAVGTSDFYHEGPVAALQLIMQTTAFYFNRETVEVEVREHARLSIEALIKAGAHVSAKDKFDRTPLHIAAKYNNMVGANALIAAGSKLMDKDDYGKTPLDYAESAEMIKLLKSAGAQETP